MMKKLKNPPAEYEDAYDAMKEFYDAYMEFADFVTNPTGSYQSFSDGFAAQDSAVLSAYRSASFELD